MTLEWKVVKDGRILISTCSDPLNLKEIVTSIEETQTEVMDKATKPVHTIMDCTNVHRLPSNMLSNSLSLMKTLHPMAGHFILVTQGGFITAMANLLHRAAPKYPMTVCATMDEAFALLDKLMAAEEASRS